MRKHHQPNEITNETMNKGNKMKKCVKCGRENVFVDWVPEGARTTRDYPRYQDDIDDFLEDEVTGADIVAVAKKEFLLCECDCCGYRCLVDTEDNK